MLRNLFRALVFPFALVAGCLIGLTAALIYAPFMLYHFLRDRRLDEEKARARQAGATRETNHA